MKIQTLEERVINTPASLICDNCAHADTCRWITDMKAAVIETDKLCKERPFGVREWSCKHYLNLDIWNQHQTTAVPFTEDNIATFSERV